MMVNMFLFSSFKVIISKIPELSILLLQNTLTDSLEQENLYIYKEHFINQ